MLVWMDRFFLGFWEFEVIIGGFGKVGTFFLGKIDFFLRNYELNKNNAISQNGNVCKVVWVKIISLFYQKKKKLKIGTLCRKNLYQGKFWI